MTTTQEPPVSTGRPAAPQTDAPTGRRGRLDLGRGLGWVHAVRSALGRPLTPYYLLLGASALLLTIGLVMVLSASSVYAFKASGDSYLVVKRQLMWAVIGIVVATVVVRMPPRLVRRLMWFPGLFVVVALLLATQTPLGVTVNGNTNWVSLGGVQVQPSEVAKLTLVLWAADVYANKERRLDQLRHMVVPVVPVMLVIMVLVLLQHDLGTALVVMAIMLAMLWVVGFPARYFAITLAGIGVLALVLAWTSAERVKRITNFLDPFKDFHDAGWQPAHGLFALSSGGVLGQGIGASQQKWGDLPEAHTDFIFAVLGEELGLFGTVLVLVLFLTIAVAAIRMASTTTDPFVRYASFGIVVWLLGQALINVGMVLTLLPVIGIPLPLVSYGGSALVPSIVALGLLISFARREPEAAAALAARRRGR